MTYGATSSGARDAAVVRVVLAAVGLGYIGVAYGLSDPEYVFSRVFDHAPWLYVAMYAFTGIACIAWAAKPHVHQLYAASFLMAVGASASRSMGLLFMERATVPALNWLITLGLTFLLWPRLMAELR